MYSKVNKNAIIGEDTTTSKSKKCIYMTKRILKMMGKCERRSRIEKQDLIREKNESRIEKQCLVFWVYI